MEPRCFTLRAFYLPASLIVRTEPQSEIGRNRRKKSRFVTCLSHAQSSLQVANAHICLRPLLLVSAQREKTSSRQEKNIGTEKNTFGSRKKRLAAEKSCFCSGEKRQQQMPSQPEKFKAAKKAPLQQKKSFWRQRKNRPRWEKTVRGKKNQAEAGKKLAAEKAQLCNPKVAATCNRKIHFRSGKKQQPQFIETRRS